jgi:hypothetical protein
MDSARPLRLVLFLAASLFVLGGVQAGGCSCTCSGEPEPAGTIRDIVDEVGDEVEDVTREIKKSVD